MDQKTWTAVDDYLSATLIGSDPALTSASAANAEAKLPAFDVPPNQGKLLQLIARISGAKRILELGTLGGYSTIWLARALPAGGKLITIESQEKHARVARENIRRAKLQDVVEMRVGVAVDLLQGLVNEGAEPFDFIFIDADKKTNLAYLDWSLKLSRPGTVIVGENVIRDGKIIDTQTNDPRVQGVQDFFEMLGSDDRLTATALQTVGRKGYAGFALAIVEPTSNDDVYLL